MYTVVRPSTAYNPGEGVRCRMSTPHECACEVESRKSESRGPGVAGEAQTAEGPKRREATGMCHTAVCAMWQERCNDQCANSKLQNHFSNHALWLALMTSPSSSRVAFYSCTGLSHTP
jgi:hypothetical protein